MQLLVKYSRSADPMEQRPFHTHTWREFKKNDTILQPHLGLVTSVLANFHAKISAVSHNIMVHATFRC